MSTKIKLRRDTKANWEQHNPVLADGELGLVKDTGEVKIGDGNNTFNNLKGSFTNLELIKKTYRLFHKSNTGDNWVNLPYNAKIPFSEVLLYDKSVSDINSDDLVTNADNTLYYNVKYEGLYFFELCAYCDTGNSYNKSWRIQVINIRNGNEEEIGFVQDGDDNFSHGHWHFSSSVFLEYLLPNDKVYLKIANWTHCQARLFLYKNHTHFRIFRLV